MEEIDKIDIKKSEICAIAASLNNQNTHIAAQISINKM